MLLRETDVRSEESPDSPPAPPEPATVAPACPTCGAEMAPDQDWCLACGHAAPGRLGSRPGIRAAATVAAVTLTLAAGAVAASYAALQDDPPKQPAATAPVGAPDVAQVPPITSPPTAITPPAATPPAQPAPGATPKTPKAALPPSVSTPPVPSSPSAGTPATPPKASKPKPAAPPAPTGPEPITLGADAVSLYDPYTRSTSSGDPVDAYDGDTSTVWKASTAKDGKAMAVGLVVDLGGRYKLDSAQITVRSPGMRTEVYAADSKTLPPDVNDTRWAHLRDASDMTKGQTTISLPSGKTKYRYVLLWFTTPPKAGSTVRVSELQILG